MLRVARGFWSCEPRLAFGRGKARRCCASRGGSRAVTRPVRREDSTPVLGVALSVALHLAVLGGLLWWGLREKPEEPATEGLELIWQQPGEQSLAGEGELPLGEPPEPPPVPDATPPAPPPPPSLAAAPPPPPVARPPAAPPAALPPPLPAAPDGVVAAPPAPPLPPVPPAETRSATAAAPAVRVPPLALPETPPTQPRRQAATPPPQPRPARPPPPRPGVANGAAEPQSAPSGGGAVAVGVTAAPSVDPNFPRPDPVYPLASRMRGEQGIVAVSIVVGPDGRVQAVRILRSSGYPALDESARRAILTSWRFRPAMRQGEPVSGTIDTSIQFNLQ